MMMDQVVAEQLVVTMNQHSPASQLRVQTTVQSEPVNTQYNSDGNDFEGICHASLQPHKNIIYCGIYLCRMVLIIICK